MPFISFWIKEHEANSLNWHLGSLVGALRGNLSSGQWGLIKVRYRVSWGSYWFWGGELRTCPRHKSPRVPGTTQHSGAWLSPDQPSYGTQVRICTLSGPAIATQRHGGGPETLKELTLAPGHLKAQYLSRGHTLVIRGTKAFREFEIWSCAQASSF